MGIKWKDVSQSIRKLIVKCQWCGIHKDDYKLKYLECHHLVTRGHGNNKEYRLCPFNLIVVCQDCHTMLEPFAKVTGQLTLVDDLGKEIKEVECCQRAHQCPLWLASIGAK